MLEIRFHGRGGQGAVIASKILAEAVFLEGKFVQSFPAFGVERRGAPVLAFTRIDDRPIRIRCEIYEPDHVVVLDPTLLESVKVTAGLRPGGVVLVNTTHTPAELEARPELGLAGFVLATVNAGQIAASHRLGSPAYPIVNTAVLGALAHIEGVAGIESVLQAIRSGAPIKPEANARAAQEAYEQVVFDRGETHGETGGPVPATGGQAT